MFYVFDIRSARAAVIFPYGRQRDMLIVAVPRQIVQVQLIAMMK